jgi:hypothetical protein
MRIAGALLVLAGLGGCYWQVPESLYTPCSAIGSRDWQARIVDTPRPRLVVSGQVAVPTGGYRVALQRGPVQRLAPPVQQVVLRTTPPKGSATQAVVTHAVQGTFEPDEGVERVEVRCGDGIVALIPTIEREAAD